VKLAKSREPQASKAQVQKNTSGNLSTRCTKRKKGLEGGKNEGESFNFFKKAKRVFGGNSGRPTSGGQN